MKRQYNVLATRLTAIFCGIGAIWILPGNDWTALALNIVGYSLIAGAALLWGGLSRILWLPGLLALAGLAFDIAKFFITVDQFEGLYRLDSVIFLFMIIALLTAFSQLAQSLERSDLASLSARLRNYYIPIAFVGIGVLFLAGLGVGSLSSAVAGWLMMAAMGLYVAIPLSILALIWTLRGAAQNAAIQTVDP